MTDPSILHTVVPYPASNSSVRTRALHWIERLTVAEEESSAVVYGPGFQAGRPPVDSNVLLLRNARRFTRGGYEERLLRQAKVGVYDIDDGLPWDDGNLPGLGHWWKRPWPRSLVALRSAQAADRVIAGNDLLADWASARCGDVRVIPTCVEPSEYRRRSDWSIDDRNAIVGWIGSPATEHYVHDIADALVAANQRTGMRLEMIGASSAPPAAIASFTRVVAWDPGTSLERLATWDVGIMPLRDGPYERAKCGYKLLQYAAAGVPAVGSPVGVNSSMLAATSAPSPVTLDEWADALTEVLESSADQRGAMASAGFDLAERYSYDAWQSSWADAVGWGSA